MFLCFCTHRLSDFARIQTEERRLARNLPVARVNSLMGVLSFIFISVYAATLCFFRFISFQFYLVTVHVLTVWSGLGTKTTVSGLGKHYVLS